MAERNYLQHGRRHLPTGTDPIPGLTIPAGLPTALCSNSTVPINHLSTSSDSFALDTLSTNDSSIYSLSLGQLQLAAGLYIGVGLVQLNTFADWTGDTNYLAAAFELSTGFTMGVEAVISPPDNIIQLCWTDMLNLANTTGVDIEIGVSGAGIGTLPENIAAIKAGFTRVSSALS